jgi:hypothetical protein
MRKYRRNGTLPPSSVVADLKTFMENSANNGDEKQSSSLN